MQAQGATQARSPVLPLGPHRTGSAVPKKILIPVFLIFGALASFIYCGVPMNGGSDSAWYYMNAHYLLTGQYIWETGYPSFTGPNQFFFPHGGYSQFIYVTKLLEGRLGVSWIVMLRVIQLGAYLASAALVYAIGSRFKYAWAGLAGMVCFFLYAPFLGYATTLLSETITTFLVLLVIWLFLKGLLENRKVLLCLCFFLAGYAVLLKPVLWLVVGLLAVTMVACQWRARRVGLWGLALALTAVCSLAQSIESKVVFGNYRVRAGNGLNLWNRVIAQDQCFPADCDEGQRIGDARVYDFPVKRGMWWLAATYFSKVRGYSKEQTEEVISKIAWQGLMEHKARYAAGTVSQAWYLLMADARVLYTDLDPARPYGFKGPDQAEPQQLPLVRELVRQNDWSGQETLGGVPAKLYSQFADLFGRVQRGDLQTFIAVGYLALLLAAAVGLRHSRDSERLVMLATLLTPGMIVVGSCLAESPDPRFRLPAQPLLILACCVGACILAAKAFALKGGITPAGAGRRQTAYACLAVATLALIVPLAGRTSFWLSRNMMCEHPVELSESTMAFQTDLLLRGENPYSLRNQPVYTNTYGILYPWMVRPFASLFGNTLPVHRAVSCFFLLAGCGCFLWILRRQGIPLLLAIAGAAVLFVYLASDVNGLVRPDSLGFFLFLASLAVPLQFGFRPRPLAAAVVLAMLAFMAKPYFVLSVPLLGAYLFLFCSKAKGLLFTAASGLALTAMVLVLDWAFECYFTDIFFMSRNIPTDDLSHVLRTANAYLWLTPGWLLILAAPLVTWAWQEKGNQTSLKSSGTSRLEDRGWFSRPLLPRHLSFPAFVLIVNGCLIVFKLGSHNGAGATYWHHLISPFLIWTALAILVARPRLAGWGLLLVLANVPMGYAEFWSLPTSPQLARQWDALRQKIAPYKKVFADAPVSLLASSPGKEVYDSGQTECLAFALLGNTSSVAPQFQARTNAFMQGIVNKVQHKEFDAVVLSYRSSPMVLLNVLERSYYLAEQVPLNLPFGPVIQEIYRPRRGNPADECRTEASSISAPAMIKNGLFHAIGHVTAIKDLSAETDIGTSQGVAYGSVLEVRQDDELVCLLQVMEVGDHLSSGIIFDKRRTPVVGHKAGVSDYNFVFADTGSFLINEDITCNFRGMQQFGNGDIAGALTYFDRAIEINPRSADAYNNRAGCFAAQGQYGRAIADCSIAIEIEPNSPTAYYNRGTALLSKKDYAHAIEDFTRSTQLQPGHAKTYFNRGAAYFARREYAQAIQDWTRLIELNPEQADPYMKRANAYRLLKDYDKAWADVERVRRMGAQVPQDLLERLTQESPQSGTKGL